MPIPGTKIVETIGRFLAGEEGTASSVSARREPVGSVLYSFAEPIAILDERTQALYVELDWKYSRTTSRHRSLLMSAADGRFDVTTLTREQIRGRVGLDPYAPPPMIR